MFKEYTKLKTAEAHLTALVAEGEKQLDYRNSVLDELDRAETERDLADIRRELFKRVAARNWSILSMKTNELSLEDIFLKLTIGGGLDEAEVSSEGGVL